MKNKLKVDELIEILEKECKDLNRVPESKWRQDTAVERGDGCGCKMYHQEDFLADYYDYIKPVDVYSSLFWYIHGKEYGIQISAERLNLPMTKMTRKGCQQRIKHVIEYLKEHREELTK